MAFTPKTWLGRQVEHPGRIQLIPTADPTVFDVARFEGDVEQEGDFLGTTNLNDLEQRIYDGCAAGGTGRAALNALALGGVAAEKYPQISSGSFTPTLFGTTTAGTPTYTQRNGSWWRIGKRVDLNFIVSISNKGGMAGGVIVGGFPFATAGNLFIGSGNGFPSGFNLPVGSVFSGVSAYSGGGALIKSSITSITNVFDNEINDTFSTGYLSVSYYTN